MRKTLAAAAILGITLTGTLAAPHADAVSRRMTISSVHKTHALSITGSLPNKKATTTDPNCVWKNPNSNDTGADSKVCVLTQ